MAYKNESQALREKVFVIAGSLVVFGIGGTIMKYQANTLNGANIFGFILICVAAYHLMKGKEWAKYYLSLVAFINLLLLLFNIPGFFGSELPILIKIVFLILYVSYLVWLPHVLFFLNMSDDFPKYQDLVAVGVDFERAGKTDISELVKLEKGIVIDFKTFLKMDDYIQLAHSIFKILEVEDKIESISIATEDESKILVETEDTIYEIGVHVRTGFFDKRFLGKTNTILHDIITKDKFLDIIYPNTILNVQEKILIFEDTATFASLEAEGYYRATSIH